MGAIRQCGADDGRVTRAIDTPLNISSNIIYNILLKLTDLLFRLGNDCTFFLQWFRTCFPLIACQTYIRRSTRSSVFYKHSFVVVLIIGWFQERNQLLGWNAYTSYSASFKCSHTADRISYSVQMVTLVVKIRIRKLRQLPVWLLKSANILGRSITCQKLSKILYSMRTHVWPFR